MVSGIYLMSALRLVTVYVYNGTYTCATSHMPLAPCPHRPQSLLSPYIDVLLAVFTTLEAFSRPAGAAFSGSHRDSRSASDLFGRGTRGLDPGPSRHRIAEDRRTSGHGTESHMASPSVESGCGEVCLSTKGALPQSIAPSTSCEVSTSNRVCAVSIQLCQEV